MPKSPCVYIMASKRNGTLYVGVTSNLPVRVSQHKKGDTPGFTSRYAVRNLVWYEVHESMDSAIAREKEIKRWPRQRKMYHIELFNPEWRDLLAD